MFLVFYTQSVSPSAHGNFYELYAIAAAVLGGCSLRGGEGSIIGIVLGTVLLQVLQNLVNMLGIPSSLNFAVMGAVILLGVLADQQLQRRRQRALAHGERGGAQPGAPAGGWRRLIRNRGAGGTAPRVFRHFRAGEPAPSALLPYHPRMLRPGLVQGQWCRRHRRFRQAPGSVQGLWSR